MARKGRNKKAASLTNISEHPSESSVEIVAAEPIRHLEGWLTILPKLGLPHKRWFVLSGCGQLGCYLDPTDSRGLEEKSVFGCHVTQGSDTDSEYPNLHCFCIENEAHDLYYMVAADDAHTRSLWIASLRALSSRVGSLPPSFELPLGGSTACLDVKGDAVTKVQGVQEITAYIKKGGVQSHHIKAIFEEIGTEKSGELSWQEFQLLAERFPILANIDKTCSTTGDAYFGSPASPGPGHGMCIHHEGWLWRHRHLHPSPSRNRRLRTPRQDSEAPRKLWMVLSGNCLQALSDPTNHEVQDQVQTSGCRLLLIDDAPKGLVQFGVEHDVLEYAFVFVCESLEERQRWLEALQHSAALAPAQGSLGGRGGGIVDVNDITLGQTPQKVFSTAYTSPTNPASDTTPQKSPQSTPTRPPTQPLAHASTAAPKSLSAAAEGLDGGGGDHSLGGGRDSAASCRQCVAEGEEEEEEEDNRSRAPFEPQTQTERRTSGGWEMVVECDAKRVVSLIFALEASSHLDPRCIAVGEVARVDSATSVRHYRFASPTPFAPRDVCALVSGHKLGDGFLICAASVDCLDSSSLARQGSLAAAASQTSEFATSSRASVAGPAAACESCPAAPGTIRANLLCGGYFIHPLAPSQGVDKDQNQERGGMTVPSRGGVWDRELNGQRCLVRCVGVVHCQGVGHWVRGVGAPFARPECMLPLKSYLESSQSTGYGCTDVHEPSAGLAAAGVEVSLPLQRGAGGYGKGTQVKGRGGSVAMRALPFSTALAAVDNDEEVSRQNSASVELGVPATPHVPSGATTSVPSGVRMAGWLYKRRMILPGTRKRWVELRDRTLRYYLTPHDHAPRGTFDLRGCQVGMRERSEGLRPERLLGLYLIVIYLKTARWPLVLGVSSRRACLQWLQMILEASRCQTLEEQQRCRHCVELMKSQDIAWHALTSRNVVWPDEEATQAMQAMQALQC